MDLEEALKICKETYGMTADKAAETVRALLQIMHEFNKIKELNEIVLKRKVQRIKRRENGTRNCNNYPYRRGRTNSKLGRS